MRVLRWSAFHIVAGNSDAHGKNLSLLYGDGDVPSLAPFYDLVSTRAYRGLDRMLAMRIGSTRDPDRVAGADLRDLADTLDVSRGLLRRVFVEMAEACVDRVAETVDAFRDDFGDSPILQTLPKSVSKRAKALQTRVRG